jgi:DNA-binding PadR family transcriptional regulator
MTDPDSKRFDAALHAMEEGRRNLHEALADPRPAPEWGQGLLTKVLEDLKKQRTIPKNEAVVLLLHLLSHRAMTLNEFEDDLRDQKISIEGPELSDLALLTEMERAGYVSSSFVEASGLSIKEFAITREGRDFLYSGLQRLPKPSQLFIELLKPSPKT